MMTSTMNWRVRRIRRRALYVAHAELLRLGQRLQRVSWSIVSQRRAFHRVLISFLRIGQTAAERDETHSMICERQCVTE